MPHQRPPLVGRDDELGDLRRATGLVAAGGRCTLLVTGEPGIGKSRLAAAAADAARSAGFLVAVGRCAPVSAVDLAYDPVLDLLTDVIGQQPQLPDQLPTPVRRSLAALLGTPDDPTSGRSDSHLTEVSATRIFASVVALLSAAARSRPVLVIVEDVHWADPASADLLAYAARTGPDRLALLLTARTPHPDTRTALDELRRLPDTVEIRLGPLAGPDLGRLIEGVLDRSDRTAAGRAGVTDRIRRLCGGNPFYAEQLAATRTIGQIPPRLRDLVSAELATPGPAARLVVRQLAVMGPTAAGLLPDACALDPVDVDAALRELTGRNLIMPPTAGGTVRFRHDLFGEVAAELTMPAESAAAHCRAADALLAGSSGPLAGRNPDAAIAHHLIAGGRPGAALPHALRAARQAGAIRAFGNARRSYEQALNCWPAADDAPAATGLTLAALVREAADAYRWDGDPQAAVALIDRHAEAGPGVTDTPAPTPIERSALAHARGQAQWAAGDLEAAVSDHRAALAMLPADAPAAERAGLLAALAQALMTTGRATESLTLATAASRLLPAGAPATRGGVNAQITAAAAKAQLGDVETAVTELRAAVPFALALDDIELVTRCFGNLTFALGRAGRPAEVIEAAAAGERAGRRYGPVLSLASTMINNEVAALTTLGRWDEALACTSRALREVTAPAVRRHLRLGELMIAVARGADGGIDTELAALAESVRTDPYALAVVSVLRAQRACHRRDPAAAAAHIDDALPTLVAQEDDVTLLDACWWGLRAEADRARDRIPPTLDAAGRDRGNRLIELAREAARRSPNDPVAGAKELCEAEFRRAAGLDDADDWVAALTRLGPDGDAAQLAYCRLRLGSAQLRRQARSAAAGTLADGLRLAESLRAAPLIAQFRAVAEASDLPIDRPTDRSRGPGHPRRPSPADRAGLTPRERQVLALVTTGATNRAIGRRLQISERTAGVHVANILGKLGVGNRTEAAQLAQRWNLDVLAD